MVAWMLRGVSMSVVHVVARVLLGLAIVHAPLQGTYWKTLAVAVVVLIAIIWGGIDGIADGRAHDDPEDYDDLTIRWLKAGLFTGVVSAIISWALSNYVVAGMGQNSIFVELFAGGSFTTLLVFIPALAGAALGRFLAHRQRNKNAKQQNNDTGAEQRQTADTH
ncbi:B-4DMT family transporter [Williamsia sp. M5A3_1d]